MVQMNKRLAQENRDLKAKFEQKFTNKMQTIIKEEQDKEKERIDAERIKLIESLREESK